MTTGNHIIYASCGGQSNGDKNDKHCFGGPLFNQEHVCTVCRQKNNFVLMHVCDELLPPNMSSDVMCGDCIVRAFLTTNEHRTAFVPQRHATPVVTCLLGMTLLQEIQNIICTIDADSGIQGKWTWSFEIEKSIIITQKSKRKRAVAGGEDPLLQPSAAPVTGTRSSGRVAQMNSAKAIKAAKEKSSKLRMAEAALKRLILRRARNVKNRRENLPKPPPAQKNANAAHTKGIDKAAEDGKVADDKEGNEKEEDEKEEDDEEEDDEERERSPSPGRPALRAVPKRQDVDLMIKVKRNNSCIFYILGTFVVVFICNRSV